MKNHASILRVVLFLVRSEDLNLLGGWEKSAGPGVFTEVRVRWEDLLSGGKTVHSGCVAQTQRNGHTNPQRTYRSKKLLYKDPGARTVRVVELLFKKKVL